MTTAQVSAMILAVVGAVALAGAASLDSAAPPDAEFLEFLGSWHTGDDRWVDPFHVDEAPGVESGEQNPDKQVHDADGQHAPRATPPYDGTRKQRQEPTIPRRDVKP